MKSFYIPRKRLLHLSLSRISSDIVLLNVSILILLAHLARPFADVKYSTVVSNEVVSYVIEGEEISAKGLNITQEN